MIEKLNTWRREVLRPLWSTPAGEKARLEAELLNAIATDAKIQVSFLFGILCATLALPWVHNHWLLALWLATVILYPIPLAKGRIANNRYARQLTNVDRAMLRALVMELPFHVIWLLFVPLCWVPGNAANNAFLTIFMMGSVTSAVRIYGPCYKLSIPAIAVFLPFVATYALSTGTTMSFTLPIVQVAFLGILVMLAVHHYETFKESTQRRFTIEAMAQKLTEARDEAERASKAKSAFLASMSHELRTPLNAIIGFSDMMRQGIFGPLKPPKYQEYVGDIYASGQHLLYLINDVLDLSKIEAGKREFQDCKIDVLRLAGNAALFVAPQAQQGEIEVKIDVPKGMKLVADERALSQVLINFLSNAIKFSPKGETVTIFARRTNEGGLALGVVDHGVGMDREGIEKALEPYGQVMLTTPENQGTGLGLPIAKALVEAHGAVFKIESAIGSGTSVWGDFPPQRVLS